MFALTKAQLNQAQIEDKIAEALADVDLDALDLQPTSRAYEMAAHAALVVLLAHDLGQADHEVTRDVGAELASAQLTRPNGRHAPKARRRSSARPLAKIKRKNPGMAACPKCGRQISRYGMTKHIRACTGEPAPAAA